MRVVTSAGTWCDLIDISQECCVQYHERENNRRFDAGIVKYVWEGIYRLVNLQIGEGNSVTKHISEFNTIIAQLTSVQITSDDEVKTWILLSSLPES